MNHRFNISNSKLIYKPLNIIIKKSESNSIINNVNENKVVLPKTCCSDNIINAIFVMKKYMDGNIVFTLKPNQKLLNGNDIKVEKVYFTNTYNSTHIVDKDIFTTYTNLEDLNIYITNEIYDKIKPNKLNINVLHNGVVYNIIGIFIENLYIYRRFI